MPVRNYPVLDRNTANLECYGKGKGGLTGSEKIDSATNYEGRMERKMLLTAKKPILLMRSKSKVDVHNENRLKINFYRRLSLLSQVPLGANSIINR